MDERPSWRIGKIRSNKLRLIDDFSDKLNYKFSFILIIVLIILIAVNQYFAKPIQCWTPQEFTKSWEEYARDFCGISDTYLNFDKEFKSGSQFQTINYIQWISIVLAVQGILFFIPCMIWRLLILHSGFNLQRITQAANNTHVSFPDQLKKSIKFIAIHMDKFLNKKYNNETTKSCSKKRCCSQNSRRYLSSVYIIIKILYLLNVVFQLCMIQRYIGTRYSFYGIDAFYDMVKGNELRSSDYLPKVKLCKFEITKLNRRAFYTLQCVLPLNMFLEKIFILLWFWNVIIGCITAVSLLSWLNKLVNRKDKVRFIGEYLKLMELLKESEESLVKKFIFDYLRTDGLFIMHLISTNVGDIVAADIVGELLDLYRSQEKDEYEPLNSVDEINLSENKLKNVEKIIGLEIPGKSYTNDNIF